MLPLSYSPTLSLRTYYLGLVLTTWKTLQFITFRDAEGSAAPGMTCDIEPKMRDWVGVATQKRG